MVRERERERERRGQETSHALLRQDRQGEGHKKTASRYACVKYETRWRLE